MFKMSIAEGTLTVNGKVVGRVRDISFEGTLAPKTIIADVIGQLAASMPMSLPRQERYCRQCASERCGHLHSPRCPVRNNGLGLETCTCAPVKEPGIRLKRRARRVEARGK